MGIISVHRIDANDVRSHWGSANPKGYRSQVIKLNEQSGSDQRGNRDTMETVTNSRVLALSTQL